MIWNAWVLGLIIGQMAVAMINGVAFINALIILRRWNATSYAPFQLNLEHRSELVATIVSWSLSFQIFSLLLFEITTRKLAPSIAGAMCTVGSLEAHYLGWPILFTKLGAFFLYGLWMIVNHVDLQLEGFPLTKFKNGWLVVLFPLVIADVLMQILYFSGLDPTVITSCCGVIFEVSGNGFGSSVASLPPQVMKWSLLGFVGGMLVLSYAMRWERKPGGRLIYAFFSGTGFVLGVAGVVSFVAPTIYMMPALHCPFIFLDQEHWHYGYLVYLPLFTASLLGVSPALLAALVKANPDTGPNTGTDTRPGTGTDMRPDIRKVAHKLATRFIKYSRMAWIIFLLTAYAPVIRFWIATGGKADLFEFTY